MATKYLNFKDVLYNLLKDLQISQSVFAKNIGTTQGTVSKWLSGFQEPRYYQLQKIITTFNLDPSEVMGLKEF